MKSNIVLAAVPVLAALAGPVAAVPAYAVEPAPSADLRVAYGNPELAPDGSAVTWRWSLTNAGAAEAAAVVTTHQVSADQKIVGVSKPCANTNGDAVCRFGAVKPGERLAGWIRTSVTKPGGTLRINAQVTWHENPSYVPGAGRPSVVDAGPANGPGDPSNTPGARGPESRPRVESWGVAGSDASTDMPGQSG